MPPNFSSPSDLANVLANEPAAAASSVRFSEVQGPADVITFRDDSSSSSSSSSSNCGNSCSDASNNGDEDDGEFDAQLGQVEEDIKRMKEQGIRRMCSSFIRTKS